MGRYKSAEVKGLFFNDFSKIFEDSLKSTVAKSEVPQKELLEKLTTKYKEIVASYEETISSIYLKHHKFKFRTFLNDHLKTQRIPAETHKNSFQPFFLYIDACVLIYEKASGQIVRKRIDSTLKVNLSLYGLIVRRAQQIGDMLLNGYIDGAMMIWRSFYENCIILLVLATENSPNLADRFYQHSVRNSQRGVATYTKHHKDLALGPLPKSTFKNIEQRVNDLKDKYGKDFLDNEYGWADDLFPGKQKANFRAMEERVEMSKYRPFYLSCSEHVHSTFNGLKNYTEKGKIYLPALLNKEIELEGYIDPMQFTINVLHDVNDYILYEFSTKNEYEANVLLMWKIFEQQQNSFNSES